MVGIGLITVEPHELLLKLCTVIQTHEQAGMWIQEVQAYFLK